MALSRPLDTATLDRLVRCLSDLGVHGITDRERGLSINEIRSLTRDIPASLPSEVQLWFSRWTWGEDLYDMLPRLRYHPLPNCVFLYDQALEMARLHRQGVAQARGGETPAGYEPTWLSLWFPLSQKEGPIYVAVDLSASDGDTAPVLEVDNGGGDATRVARSLGEYVTHWLDEIEAGQWLYDREEHIWEPKGGWAALG
jgi:cell wall assembly regulator SMI1